MKSTNQKYMDQIDHHFLNSDNNQVQPDNGHRMFSYPNVLPQPGFVTDRSALVLGNRQSTMYSEQCMFDQKYPNENEFFPLNYQDDLIMDENAYDMFDRPVMDPTDQMLESRALQEVPLYQLNDMQNRPSYNNQMRQGNGHIVIQNNQAKKGPRSSRAPGQIVSNVSKAIIGRRTVNVVNTQRTHHELNLQKQSKSMGIHLQMESKPSLSSVSNPVGSNPNPQQKPQENNFFPIRNPSLSKSGRKLRSNHKKMPSITSQNNGPFKSYSGYKNKFESATSSCV